MTKTKDDLTTRVKALHKAGMGRNAIARELGVSHRQVDNAARALGIEFGRIDEKALHGRKLQAQAQRDSIAAAWRELAEVNLAIMIDAAADSERVEEMRARATIAGVATDKAAALEAIPRTVPRSDTEIERMTAYEKALEQAYM